MASFSKLLKQYKLVPGKHFMFSSSDQTITYIPSEMKSSRGKLALMHEIGHCVLKHRVYTYDMTLLQMEMDAWEYVRREAPKYGIPVDEDHINRCISTYDHWISKRATCPDCRTFSLQRNAYTFGCFACGAEWKVNRRKDRRVTRIVIGNYKHKLDLDTCDFENE